MNSFFFCQKSLRIGNKKKKRKESEKNGNFFSHSSTPKTTTTTVAMEQKKEKRIKLIMIRLHDSHIFSQSSQSNHS